MKRSSELLGLGLVVAGLLAAAETSEGAQNAVLTPISSSLIGNAASGKETFTQYCSICHGVGAKGFIGPSIAGINWTVPGLHAIVRGGVGGYGSMPAFNADAVSDTNIADIAAYLAALPPASSPKSSTAPQPTAGAAASSLGSLVAPPVSAGVGDSVHGNKVYTENCAACHGANAQGGIGPALHGERARKNTAAAIAWIKNPLPPMPKLYPTVLNEKDVDDVAAYIESL